MSATGRYQTFVIPDLIRDPRLRHTGDIPASAGMTAA